MSSKWYNPITTRTKITIVFVVLVSLVLFIMSQILFSVAEKVWKSKKMQIMQASMASMTMESDLKSKFPNYRVLQDDGSVKEQQGIFTQWNISTDSISEIWGAYYIAYEERIKDGPKLIIAEDVTDIVGAQYEQARVFVWVSWGTLALVVLLGATFTYIAFWPVRGLQKLAESFDGVTPPDMEKYIRWNPRDEFVALGKSMDHLFRRVGSHTRTLENFSDHMAHEVKNRLFEIQSTLEVGKIADPYHAIEASLPLIHHLARMSESLLLLHTTGDLQKSDIYPKDLFVNFWDFAHRLALVEKDRNLWNVDPSLFSIALFNIVQNALKYSTDIVDIFVDTDRIVIRDRGVGIPAEEFPYVFDRLFKGDAARTFNTGYGLGLSITQKIVLAHGMQISLESTLGVGTTVQISRS